MKIARLILDEPLGPPTLDLLNSLQDPPSFRGRIHTLMALYAYSPPGRREAILDEVERMLLEIAGYMASEISELLSDPDTLPPTRPGRRRNMAET